MKKLGAFFFMMLLYAETYAQTGNIVIPAGHALKVEAVMLDKQGKYLYTAESAKAIMWDAKTHEQLYTFPLGVEKISNLAVSDDGTMIAVGCGNHVKCFSTLTGKKINLGEEFYSGNSVSFSPDSKLLYSIDYGIMAYNFAKKEKNKLVPNNSFNLFEESIETVDEAHILTYNRLGWQLWNLNTKAVEFQYKYENSAYKTDYLPNLNCVAYYGSGGLTFRDISTGKLLKVLPVKSTDYVVIPSVDSKSFFFGDGQAERSDYTIYDGSTFLPISRLHAGRQVNAGCFKGASGTLFASNYSDVFVLNTATGKVGSRFKRQVADLGMDVFSSLEYNYTTGTLNLMTDDSVYKSVNLVKLKPFRHKPLPVNSDIVTFSATGDTVAVFDYKKAYIKNIVTGKFLQPAIKLLDESSTTERKNFFFDKTGTHVYFTTFSIPRQLCTLNRINIKTGIVEKMLTFRSTTVPSLHPDKDLLAGIEYGYLVHNARVWNVNTGKLIFDIALDKDKCEFITISNDKKRVLIVRNNTTEIYSLATGALLSKSKEYPSLGQFGIYACTPDLSLVFKCEYSGMITAIDATGKEIYFVKGHYSSIRNALFSPDSKIMYTVSTDQTIKVWQPLTGKLLGTIYLFNDGNDFVFVDEYGRFDGTEGGIKRMYYYRDRIKVSLDVVYEKFYTPNLYQRLVNGEQFDPIDIIINPQPKVRISYAQVTRNLNVVDDKTPVYNNTTGVAEITVNASAENDKIDEIRLFHNGKIVNLATRGLFVTDNTTGTDTKTYTVTLLPGVNNIRAIALNSQRTESEPDDINVAYNSPGQTNTPVPVNKGSGGTIDQVDRNATLHLIVVGINAYKNPKMSLNYALADATAFKDEAEKDAHTMITNLKTYFVTDGKADKSGIIAAFTEVQKNAKPQDVFVFYYAGHGVISEKNKEFYLVPNDVTDLKNVDAALEQNGIPSKMLQQYAINIAAQKQVFILDACQSAGAFAQLLANDGDQQKNLAVVARSTGTHWIAASGSQQFANEFSQLGHGVFTYVLLKAMKGEAANNKMVTVNGLKNFLQVQVPDLMRKYNGTPQYPSSYGYGNDFPVQVIK